MGLRVRAVLVVLSLLVIVALAVPLALSLADAIGESVNRARKFGV
jgi:hypothetical protein